MRENTSCEFVPYNASNQEVSISTRTDTTNTAPIILKERQLSTDGSHTAIASVDKSNLHELAPEITQQSEEAQQCIHSDMHTPSGTIISPSQADDLSNKHHTSEQKKQHHPNIKSAYDLMQTTLTSPDWVVEGILPPGLIALAGKQKIGKSWLVLDLGVSVALASPFLGSIPVKGGHVLYLALEDNDRRLQDRLKTLVAPRGVVPQNLEYTTQWARMDGTGLRALEEWIQTCPNARLIIIDPWVKVKPHLKQRAGETSYDADYQALQGLKQLADKYHICILVLFHLRKAPAEDPFDVLNGSTGVTACADGFLSLKRRRGQSEATLWGTGRDYKEEVNMALTFDNGQWCIAGSVNHYSLSPASQEVIDILVQAGKPLFPKEIATKLGKSDSSSIRKRLSDMKQRGEVKDTGNGYIALVGNGGNGGNGTITSNTGNGGNAHQLDDCDEKQGVCLF